MTACICITREDIGPGVPKGYATWLAEDWRSECAEHGNPSLRNVILTGDVREQLRRIPDETVDCCVTSPPYWSLRDYGVEPTAWGGGPECDHDFSVHHVQQRGGVYTGKKRWQHITNGRDEFHPDVAAALGRDDNGQRVKVRDVDPAAWGDPEVASGDSCAHCGAWRGALGLEPTHDLYVEHIVEIMRGVRRVLKKKGTLWLNLGDSYSGSGRGMNGDGKQGKAGPKQTTNTGSLLDFHDKRVAAGVIGRDWVASPPGLKPKDLVGIPWRVAFALQADGWWLRSDIIWCLSAGTSLYAKTANAEGPATLHDLVRLDPRTVQLWNGERWTRVRGWSKRQSETLRITLGSGERIIVSPNHRWPLTDERIVETQELVIGDVLATTNLPEPEHPTDEGIPSDLAWFAGLYLAEGSRSDDAIQIAGNANEVDRHERTAAIARRHGGSAVIHAGAGDAVSLVVHGAFLDAAIRHFVGGRTALDKHVHPRAWRSSNAALRAFMEGYLAGDGHNDVANNRWRLGFGNNPHLAADLRTLAARLGATLTLSPSLAKMGRTLTFEAYRGEWRWQASGHGNAKQRAEVIKIEPRSESEVWDIGVDDEPHLFALASGVLSHNSKPNPMPESVRDRPTRSHEYVFLLAKSERYYYDAAAIREPIAPQSLRRISQRTFSRQKGGPKDYAVTGAGVHSQRQALENFKDSAGRGQGRNKRSVWHIATRPYKEAHFATFASELVLPCILAGAPEGGLVLDPFMGSGTTALTAARLGRDYLGIELNPEYVRMAESRLQQRRLL